jgi:phage terminase large subunit
MKRWVGAENRMARKKAVVQGRASVSLPDGWAPRPYQLNAWNAAFGIGQERKLRHSLAWHRRAGKDAFALNRTAVAAFERVGTYWHMLPQANQARKAIWDAVDEFTGVRRIDQAFPMELRETTRDHEMFIRFKNGSTWQLVGSDNYNSLVGSPPIGLVGSEWALADPAAWAFLRPILANNGGWAMFISTPRGQNHFAKMHRAALMDPEWRKDWFAETLTVEDTKAISAEIVARELRELAAERGDTEAQSIIAQEYYCSFDAALPGSYFGELLTRMERDGQIGVHPWDPRLPVSWGSDLGMSDSTTFWLYQTVNGRPRLINFFDGSGVDDVGFYAKKLLSLPYTYAPGFMPHDGGHRRLGMAGSLSAQMRKYGLRNEVVPVTKDLVASIQATRTFLASALVNVEPEPFPDETREQANARMVRAIEGLRMYHRKWNEGAQRFDDHPVHDWASNIADGLRTVAVSYRPVRSLGDARSGGRAEVRIADGA